MKKVYLTKGLPASGKSTWAKAEVEKYPGRYKRVNKDDLRAMLDVSRWSKKNEKFVLETRNEIIRRTLAAGFHVIVDDTNLHPKHLTDIQELVKGQAEVIVRDFTFETPETCIERDLKRPNSVGSKVIWRMYNQFLKPKEEEVEPYPYIPELPDCIICDLDGTLCKLVDRGPFDVMRCYTDEVNAPVKSVLDEYSKKGVKIVLMSGRDGSSHEMTCKWLRDNNIVYDYLYQRPAGERIKDSVLKREFFDAFVREQYNVLFCLDDRNQVVDLWRSLGLTCFQVAPGDF